MLSVRPATRKTYGRTAGGKQIADDLIDALVKKEEAGYEIKGMPRVRPPLRGRRSAIRIAARGTLSVLLLLSCT
jgi:hypothetical protein